MAMKPYTPNYFPDWDGYVGVEIDGTVYVDTFNNLTTPMSCTPIERYLRLLDGIAGLMPDLPEDYDSTPSGSGAGLAD